MQVLSQFGILQKRDLPAVTQSVDLDREEGREFAGDVLRHLRNVAGWVGRVHQFNPRVSRGIAAPQLGICYKIAIVSRPDVPDGYLELINPRVVEVTNEEVADYEGCLSFFDVRGRLLRPYGMKVSLDGRSEPRVFTGSLARSIAHEIDHLNGKVYTDRALMPPIPVAEYQRMREENRIAAAPVPSRLTWLVL
ncbi:peptide deformylase [Actinoplanes sp. CA-142083]|uniref:peptide deformylase n=1 Tax=Actinoplanes sp. CA-142083 TaxID=3239903 RepID=UPI003D9156BD